MFNLIDVYIKLKLNLGNEIIVTYYSISKGNETTIFKLIDIIDFSYLLLEKNKKKIIIPFFEINEMIKSITIKGNSNPVYFNCYFDYDLFFHNNNKANTIKDIKSNLLPPIRKVLEEKDLLIELYNAKVTPLEYNELFFSDMEKKEFTTFFSSIINELTKYAIKNNLDSKLQFVAKGTTSLIYSIGDKIIKIGRPRRVGKIPYCEYILQPIINRDYVFDDYAIHIEVTEKIIPLDSLKTPYNGKSLFEIKNEMYQNLLNIGLKMTDLIYSNMGILTKKNIIHYDGIFNDVGSEESTSILNNNNLRVKCKGDIVIIDLDCLVVDDNIKYLNYLNKIGYNINNQKLKLLKK